jgi:hypothetical protein
MRRCRVRTSGVLEARVDLAVVLPEALAVQAEAPRVVRVIGVALAALVALAVPEGLVLLHRRSRLSRSAWCAPGSIKGRSDP